MERWRTSKSQVIFNRFFILSGRWCRGRRAIHYFVANVNVNPDGLNVNVNRLENDNVWNADYRHRVVVPQLMTFSSNYLGGVFISKPFFQPPSMRPISSSRVDRSA